MNIIRLSQNSSRAARTAPPTLEDLQRELAFTRRLFEVTFHSAAMGKATVDVAGRCIDVNSALANMLGYARGELRGVRFADITHADDIDADIELFESVKAGERDSYQIEKRYLKRDGGIVHTVLSVTVIRDDRSLPLQFVSEIVDISERKLIALALESANRSLQEQVVRDHLTGLTNRRGFELALSLPSDQPLHVVLLDLDNFKKVNDRLGHAAGDAVLAEAGRRLAQLFRDHDIVARIGGDEFGVILRGVDRRCATELAERVVTALAEPFATEGGLIDVGASVGVASTDDEGRTDGLMIEADAALYAAKRAGRGCLKLAA